MQITDSSYRTRFASFIKAWFRRNTVQEYKPETADLSSEKDLETFRSMIQRSILCNDGSLQNNLTQLGSLFLTLSNAGRVRFFQMLAMEFNSDPILVTDACNNWLYHRSDPESKEIISATEAVAALTTLQSTIKPPFLKLIHGIATIPGGVKLLIDMRWLALSAVKEIGEIRPIVNTITEILSLLLEPSFLDLRVITWDASSAAILEKLIEYEAIHKIYSWNDLYTRLSSNKCCFAFFHSSISEEPITFIEAAISTGPCTSFDQVRRSSELSEENATAAIIYSVYNVQKGLSGINLGIAIINGSIKEIRKKFTKVNKFYGLAPANGFANWFYQDSHTIIDLCRSNKHTSYIQKTTGEQNWIVGLRSMAKNKEILFTAEESSAMAIAIIFLCIYYYTQVIPHQDNCEYAAQMHIANNAVLNNVTWMGDNSKKGIDESLGITLGFVYEQIPDSTKTTRSSTTPLLHKDISSKFKFFSK